jgi:hypothetical protein
MRGRRSKNSPVEGFVVVQSGSGSFVGLSARGSRLDTTLSENRRNKTNIDSEEDIDTSILNLPLLNDRWRGQKTILIGLFIYFRKSPIHWVRCI